MLSQIPTIIHRLSFCVPCFPRPRRSPPTDPLMNGANTPRSSKPPPPATPPPAQSTSARTPLVNGTQKPKKKNDAPVDPAAMYESLKSRIAALEEEEVLEEEEERRFGVHNPHPSSHSSHPSPAEEAVKSVKGIGENAIHAKYIELVCPSR